MPLEVAMQLCDVNSSNYYQDTVDMFRKIVRTIFVKKNKSIQLTHQVYKNIERKTKPGMQVWFYFQSNPLADNKMSTRFSGPYKVLYQEGKVLWVIQPLLTSFPLFLAHKAKLFECRTTMTSNQTHIEKVQLEEVNYDIALE